MTTNEIVAKFEKAKTLYDKINVMFRELHESDIIYENQSEELNVVDDIALIQCFYGVDIARIRATTTAIEFNLQMTSKPRTWVFVECQKSESECAFSWLQKYGIKYKFVKMDDDNDGIMLKDALWNIGTTICTEPKLCFVDSDVVMCDSSWARKASEGFNQYDVMSLSSFNYYQYDKKLGLRETVGRGWVNGRRLNCHCGFTLGMTRRAFERIGRLDGRTIILDDINTFYRIVGKRYFTQFNCWVKQVKLDSEHEFGYDLKLGHISNIACHVWHGNSDEKYSRLIELLEVADVKSMSEIIDYDSSRPLILPKWRKECKCRAIKQTANDILSLYRGSNKKFTKFDIEKTYYNHMSTIYQIDSDHPLYVCTVVKNGFGVDFEEFVKFRDNVEMALSSLNPVVVFFTDAKFDFESKEMNVVELKDYDSNDEFRQCERDDIIFKNGTVVYYVPFNAKKINDDVWISDYTHKFKDGSILYSVK